MSDGFWDLTPTPSLSKGIQACQVFWYIHGGRYAKLCQHRHHLVIFIYILMILKTYFVILSCIL